MAGFQVAPATRVLAFGAHPDDVELGAGGLLARLTRSGARVTIAVASVPTLEEDRVSEAQRGAKILGAESCIMLGNEPTRLDHIPMHKLVKRFDEVVQATSPDLVLTHSDRDVHWDHRTVHRATVAALRRTACDVLTYSSSSSELTASPHFHGQAYADISDTLETKLEALEAHASQVARHSIQVDFYRDLARLLGRMCGVEYAESFEVLRFRL
jgi:N-acetylglucosamine malate deacetylase 1